MKNNNLDLVSFRRKLLTNPQSLDDEMLAYLSEHPNEKSAVKEAREFDQQLTESLHIDVPEGLQARILLKQSMQLEQENGPTNQVLGPAVSKVISIIVNKPVISFMAASVFTIGFGWVLIANQFHSHEHAIIGSDDIVAHVLEHLDHEPGLLDQLLMPDTQEDMQQLFASVGAQLNEPVEGMKYAGICDIEGQDGLHIVMQQDNQPVTIIVMPGQQLAAAKAFEKSGYKGELVPVKGGLVAVIGDTLEQISLAQIRFFRAVRFA